MILPPLTLLSLPSPPSPILVELGPFALRYYGLLIILGIVAGAWLTGRELARRGFDPALATGSLFLVVPMGLVGARLYYVVAEYDLYANNPVPAVLEVWVGGLEIYGALIGGLLGLLLFSWYRGISPLAFADAAAPGLVLGQAVGRWGDYFNQELFGKTSDLPWAIRISPGNRPAEFADATSFHPTFLYESIWNLLACLALLWIARRFRDNLKIGDVFLLYVTLYSIGHLLVGTLRLDPASFLVAGSIRGDLFVGGVLALGCPLLLLVRHLARPENAPKPTDSARNL